MSIRVWGLIVAMSGNHICRGYFGIAGRRRAFTLVEMLVVMGIIALLLLATLPAFNGFGQSQSRRGAVGNLMGVLDHARMMAISDGLPTYVVFAVGSQVNPNLVGRAYAIFQDQDNINFKVVQRTAWMYLPDNVAFKVNGTDNVGSSATTASVTNQAPATTDPFFPLSGAALPTTGTSASNGVQLPYWEFDNTGMVAQKSLSVPDPQGNGYYRVLLFNGSDNASGQETSTHNNAGFGNTKAAQLEEIDINPVTGRAKYVVDPLNNFAPTPTPGTSS